MGIEIKTFESFAETNRKLLREYCEKKNSGKIRGKALEMFLGEYDSIEEVSKKVGVSGEYLVDMILCNKEINLPAAKGFEGLGYSMSYIADGVAKTGHDENAERIISLVFNGMKLINDKYIFCEILSRYQGNDGWSEEALMKSVQTHLLSNNKKVGKIDFLNMFAERFDFFQYLKSELSQFEICEFNRWEAFPGSYVQRIAMELRTISSYDSVLSLTKFDDRFVDYIEINNAKDADKLLVDYRNRTKVWNDAVVLKCINSGGCFVSVSGYDAHYECAKFDYDVALTLVVKSMCEKNLKLNNDI
ncbi:MAG: hypothetical protein R3Y65_04225 [Bacillota bacterium]